MAPSDADSPSPESGTVLAPLVQEVDSAENVVVLKTRAPGRTTFVIVAAARTVRGAALLTQGARQAAWGGRLPPGATKQKGREAALGNWRVIALSKDGAYIEHDGETRVIRAERQRVVVTDAPIPTSDVVDLASLGSDARAELEREGEALVRAIGDDALETTRAAIAQAFAKARVKLGRRIDAVRADLGRIGDAEKIAGQAQWLIAEAKRAPRGARKLEVTDWSSGEAVKIEIPLDPAKHASEQVEAMFKRAKRLRLGARVAEERLARTLDQLAAIERGEADLPGATSLAELARVAEAVKRAAPRDVTLTQLATIEKERTAGAKGKKADKSRSPYRTFLARSGRKILVGKGAADNDALTLHVARPHDLWLHAKDRTGAHVVVSLDKGQTCPGDDLVDASLLAAHFSTGRDEKVVDVQYTPRRHVRKPKGSAPGAVMVDKEKVLVLRVDAAILRALLEREDVGG